MANWKRHSAYLKESIIDCEILSEEGIELNAALLEELIWSNYISWDLNIRNAVITIYKKELDISREVLSLLAYVYETLRNEEFLSALLHAMNEMAVVVDNRTSIGIGPGFIKDIREGNIIIKATKDDKKRIRQICMLYSCKR